MIVIPSYITGFQSLKDGTLKVTIETNELNPEQKLGVLNLINKFCWAAFKEEPFKNEEQKLLESLDTDFEDGSKSQSQRLRSVLYVLYNQDREGFSDFKDYYHSKTEKLIEHFKSKIDD